MRAFGDIVRCDRATTAGMRKPSLENVKQHGRRLRVLFVSGLAAAVTFDVELEDRRVMHKRIDDDHRHAGSWRKYCGPGFLASSSAIRIASHSILMQRQPSDFIAKLPCSETCRIFTPPYPARFSRFETARSGPQCSVARQETVRARQLRPAKRRHASRDASARVFPDEHDHAIAWVHTSSNRRRLRSCTLRLPRHYTHSRPARTDLDG